MPSTLELVRNNFSRRTEIQGELREIDEAANTETRDLSEAENGRVDELRSELETIDGRIAANLEIELRSQQLNAGVSDVLGMMLDRDNGDVIDNRSIGEQFIADNELRSWVEHGARGTSPATQSDMEFRAVVDHTSTSVAALGRADRLTRIGRDFLDRRTYLLDLLPTIPVSFGSVEYVQDQSPLADLADKPVEVAEGVAKPQAGMTPVVITEAIATIAVWFNMTRQAVADFPQLQGYLDGRARYAVKRRADGQAINGNGTSPNLKGLLNRTGILTYAPVAAEARYRSIRRGIRLMEDAEAVPEIIVLNPADAEIFDLSNDATAGLHAIPNVAGAGARTSWGLQQVRSTAIASGTAMLVDPVAVAVFDRMQVTAYMTDSHASNFTANLLTLLLEARIGLGLFDPKGVCKITFNGTV